MLWGRRVLRWSWRVLGWSGVEGSVQEVSSTDTRPESIIPSSTNLFANPANPVGRTSTPSTPRQPQRITYRNAKAMRYLRIFVRAVFFISEIETAPGSADASRRHPGAVSPRCQKPAAED